MNKKIRPLKGKKQRNGTISIKHKEVQKFKALSNKVEQLKHNKQFSDMNEFGDLDELQFEFTLLQKIDYHSFIGSFVAYGLFNFFYWIDMLFY